MSKFEIQLTVEANDYFNTLKEDKGRKRIFETIGKALRFMNENLKHPSLETHEFHSKQGPNGGMLMRLMATVILLLRTFKRIAYAFFYE